MVDWVLLWVIHCHVFKICCEPDFFVVASWSASSSSMSQWCHDFQLLGHLVPQILDIRSSGLLVLPSFIFGWKWPKESLHPWIILNLLKIIVKIEHYISSGCSCMELDLRCLGWKLVCSADPLVFSCVRFELWIKSCGFFRLLGWKARLISSIGLEIWIS